MPLENAQDVVFVLDVSGSMDDPAEGQIAQINTTPVAAPPAPLVPGEPPPAVNAPPGGAPPPPPAPETMPDPNAPPADAAQPAPTVDAQAPVPQRRKIDVAQAELIDALSRLPAGTRLNVIFFNSDIDGFSPDLFVLDETTRQNLVEYVRETDADGSTALTPAMRVAFLMNAKRVVLLSDGLGNVGGNAATLLRDAREAMQGGVRIDAIGIGVDQDRHTLSRLAHESGGLYQAL